MNLPHLTSCGWFTKNILLVFVLLVHCSSTTNSIVAASNYTNSLDSIDNQTSFNLTNANVTIDWVIEELASNFEHLFGYDGNGSSTFDVDGIIDSIGIYNGSNIDSYPLTIDVENYNKFDLDVILANEDPELFQNLTATNFSYADVVATVTTDVGFLRLEGSVISGIDTSTGEHRCVFNMGTNPNETLYDTFPLPLTSENVTAPELPPPPEYNITVDPNTGQLVVVFSNNTGVDVGNSTGVRRKLSFSGGIDSLLVEPPKRIRGSRDLQVTCEQCQVDYETEMTRIQEQYDAEVQAAANDLATREQSAQGTLNIMLGAIAAQYIICIAIAAGTSWFTLGAGILGCIAIRNVELIAVYVYYNGRMSEARELYDNAVDTAYEKATRETGYAAEDLAQCLLTCVTPAPTPVPTPKPTTPAPQTDDSTDDGGTDDGGTDDPATPAPTCTPDSSDSGTSQACPDPHFVTWNGDRYDFHNECDMVHVTNDHLDLHIRTQAIWSKGGHHWSGVVLAALRFDNDVLEVNALEEENPVSVNGVPVTSNSFTLDDMYPVMNTFGRLKKSLKSTESVTVKMSGGQYIKFLIHLDSLVIRMDAHGSDFYGSKGMAGYWDKPGFIGRDGETSYEIKRGRSCVNCAMEWELDANRGDPVLFSTPSTHKCADSPQSPVSIEDVDEGRRLMELETAKDLCDHVAPEGSEWRDECIFDMLATNFDEDVLKNPAYTDPLTSVERCVAAPEEEVAAGTSSDSPNGDGDANGLSCGDLGGECVYRCNPTEYDCRPDALCIEATDLTVVDAARRRMRKLEFIEGCSCALPKVMKSSSVVDVLSTTTSGSDDDDECVDDADFDFAIGDGVRGTSMKKCEWLHEMEGRADEYCETKGSDPDAKTMIKSACRSACADYLSECL